MENREIKFRGIADVAIDADDFQVEEGQMIFGQVVFGANQTFIVGPVIDCDDEYISLKTWCSVHPETVGQYTGLKDADGVEIYEGDILTCYLDSSQFAIGGYGGLTETRAVIYDEKEARFDLEYIAHDHKMNLCDLSLGEMVTGHWDLTVVGNIHESPPPASQ